MKIPNLLQDFAMWLDTRNLKAFNKLEIMKLGMKLPSSKCALLPNEIQNRLSSGLGESKEDQAKFVLRLYFYQLLKGEKFSLDLRSTRFEFDTQWKFAGEHLAFEFSQGLTQALSDTYKTYYQDADSNIQECLEKMGLLSDHWKENEKKELEEIFLAHFNQADMQKQNFELSHLVDSFGKIFFYIKDHDGVVPSEFVMLGVYLTSLYIHLQSLGVAVDVKQCFLDALEVQNE